MPGVTLPLGTARARSRTRNQQGFGGITARPTQNGGVAGFLVPWCAATTHVPGNLNVPTHYMRMRARKGPRTYVTPKNTWGTPIGHPCMAIVTTSDCECNSAIFSSKCKNGTHGRWARIYRLRPKKTWHASPPTSEHLHYFARCGQPGEKVLEQE